MLITVLGADLRLVDVKGMNDEHQLLTKLIMR